MGNKLNQEDKLKCIEFVFRYVKDIEKNYGSYDWDSEMLKTFCAKNNINKKGNSKSHGFDYFWFSARQNNDKINDTAHHFLRHVRNAIAHANISKLSKNKKQYYELKDFNPPSRGGKQTMYGIIQTWMLWEMIEIIKRTKE